MPIMSCSKNGKSGWKYGASGHCYTGPGAREKARKQGQAIEISKHKINKANKTIMERFIENVSEKKE